MFNKLNLTNTELNLLYYLSLQKESKYPKQISKETKISTGSTSQSLRNLLKKFLIKCEIKGKEKYYSINNSFTKHLKIFLNILSINNLINKLQKISTKLILFGSYATGLNTEESDIDIFILTSDKKKVNKILNFYKKKYINKISSIILSNIEYTLLKNKDKVLYKEINNGIVLWDKKNE